MVGPGGEVTAAMAVGSQEVVDRIGGGLFERAVGLTSRS